VSAPGPEEAIVAGRVLMVISAGAGALEHAARSAAVVARESAEWCGSHGCNQCRRRGSTATTGW
jgi:hypothetical protein